MGSYSSSHLLIIMADRFTLLPFKLPSVLSLKNSSLQFLCTETSLRIPEPSMRRQGCKALPHGRGFLVHKKPPYFKVNASMDSLKWSLQLPKEILVQRRACNINTPDRWRQGMGGSGEHVVLLALEQIQGNAALCPQHLPWCPPGVVTVQPWATEPPALLWSFLHPLLSKTLCYFQRKWDCTKKHNKWKIFFKIFWSPKLDIE